MKKLYSCENDSIITIFFKVHVGILKRPQTFYEIFYFLWSLPRKIRSNCIVMRYIVHNCQCEKQSSLICNSILNNLELPFIFWLWLSGEMKKKNLQQYFWESGSLLCKQLQYQYQIPGLSNTVHEWNIVQEYFFTKD